MEMKDFRTERVFAAPIADVIAAWTTPEKVGKWWNPYPGYESHVHEMTPATGGKAHISASQPGGGKPLEFYLTYRVLNLPYLISFTVRDKPEGKESPVMKAEFEEKDGKTRMIFESPNIPVDSYSDAVSGWNAFFDKLKTVLER
jgi:uncharacterized protein YndB with AHSA1/START domain